MNGFICQRPGGCDHDGRIVRGSGNYVGAFYVHCSCGARIVQDLPLTYQPSRWRRLVALLKRSPDAVGTSVALAAFGLLALLEHITRLTPP